MIAALIEGVLAGETRSIARAISCVEERRTGAYELLDALYPHTGEAHVIGVTGAPGTGKSTLINQLARAYRRRGTRVGIIAVDPSSAFSGGALLGDRIRMRDATVDSGVFVRSMATRGAQGGLAGATIDAICILDAAGYAKVFVETIGVGQDEIDVARATHTTLVVEAPGLGDDIQAIKAGLTEIGDIYVVNKADRDGADQAVRALQMMLEGGILGSEPAETTGNTWRVPVCETNALEGTGIAGLVREIEAHRAHLQQHGGLEEKERLRAKTGLEALLREELMSRFVARLGPEEWENVISRVATRHMGPHEAIAHLLAR